MFLSFIIAALLLGGAHIIGVSRFRLSWKEELWTHVNRGLSLLGVFLSVIGVTLLGGSRLAEASTPYSASSSSRELSHLIEKLHCVQSLAHCYKRRLRPMPANLVRRGNSRLFGTECREVAKE